MIKKLIDELLNCGDTNVWWPLSARYLLVWYSLSSIAFFVIDFI